MRLNFAGQYFHRIASYDENILSAQFPRLINQDWNVDDFNIRMTFRPKLPACMGTLALVTRYDFVHTSIDSQWGIFPQDDFLAELQSGEIKKHVISEVAELESSAALFPAGELLLRAQSNGHAR